MIINLFSIFDPTSTFFPYLNLNWSRTLIGTFLFPSTTYWLVISRKNILWWKLIYKIHLEVKILLGNFKINRTLIFSSLFLFILFNNFIGLFPYIFTRTRHLSNRITLSLPLWLRLILFGWLKNINHIFTHLVPQNTPNALIPFIVLIESIRNIIRPLTLAVRLTANIIAGHLLITLLRRIGTKISILSSSLLVTRQISLLILEFAVSIIQAYVFMVLIALYSREVK